MIRTQIQLTEQQTDIVKYLAARKNVSMAKIIREAIDRYAHSEPEINREERIERAMAAVGGFHSGLKDLGTNHDKYFAESITE